MTAPLRPRIGISACLLGRSVRFDGGHKRHAFVCDALEPFVEWVPVCPEVESGMSVPRESLRLVGTSENPLLMGNQSGTDHTSMMNAWSSDKIQQLKSMHLDGYVLKKGSPSCGLARIKIYAPVDHAGQPLRNGVGLFAARLRAELPSLPLSEEGWLEDHALRETFLDSVFTHHRLRTVLHAIPSRAALVKIHAQHKLLYMAHHVAGYRELGRLVGALGDVPMAQTRDNYIRIAMGTLAKRATPAKHVNVMMHILGYFKKVLTPAEKAEVLVLLDEFRGGLHTLAVPLTLLVHHLRKHALSDWLAEQVYFEPYPRALVAR